MDLVRIAVAAAFVTAACPAVAADLDDLLPPAPVLDEEGPATWYLRGDIAAVRRETRDADVVAPSAIGDFTQDSSADSGLIGVGIGYRFSPMLRMDVTLDHRFDARFRGAAAAPTFAGGSFLDRGRLQSTTLLLNAYMDLGTWNGLTPYLGAGVGIARNTLSRYARITSDPSGAITAWEPLAGDSDSSFAWALMAGLGYEVMPGLTLDVGYRFVGLGTVKTRHYSLGSGAELGQIGAHEVRVGLRYVFE